MNDSSPPQTKPLNERKAGWGRSVPFASLLVIAGCVSCPPLPRNLQVPPGHKLMLHAYAKGVQIYVCEATAGNPGTFTWKLKAPETMLFDACGNVIGSHYSGPTWESARDGSKIVGAAITNAPSPNANSIPLLLIRAVSTEGPGIFAKTTYIQRLNTVGGQAPSIAGTTTGQEARVAYTAEYYFYRATH